MNEMLNEGRRKNNMKLNRANEDLASWLALVCRVSISMIAHTSEYCCEFISTSGNLLTRSSNQCSGENTEVSFPLESQTCWVTVTLCESEPSVLCFCFFFCPHRSHWWRRDGDGGGWTVALHVAAPPTCSQRNCPVSPENHCESHQPGRRKQASHGQICVESQTHNSFSQV